ncbi:hypothetical protein LINPERPRIM_LOCUS18238 [Linum perenne]
MESQLAVPCWFRRDWNHHHQDVSRPHWYDFSIYGRCCFVVDCVFDLIFSFVNTNLFIGICMIDDSQRRKPRTRSSSRGTRSRFPTPDLVIL